MKQKKKTLKQAVDYGAVKREKKTCEYRRERRGVYTESTIVSEGLRGAPEVPPLCRETQSLGQQMLDATVGINGLTYSMTDGIIKSFSKASIKISYLKDLP